MNSGATPYVTFFSYHFNSNTSITLNGLWPGDSGSFTYVIENTGFPSTIGTSQADHAGLQQIWACTWNSPSQITLDRPWTGASGTVNLYQSPGRPNAGYAIGGYGQQPYMLGGMAVLSLNYAAQVNDPAYQAKSRLRRQPQPICGILRPMILLPRGFSMLQDTAGATKRLPSTAAPAM
jgi:hypothetical protein